MREFFSFPYYHIPTKKEEIFIFRFLKRKFLPALKKRFKIHYLFTRDIGQYLNFIRETSQNYPFFLAFDIERYFPSISHQILLKDLPQIYIQLTQKPISRRFKKIYQKELPNFLSKLKIKDYSLPLGNPLSFLLAGIYLLRLDLELPCPFLRFTDDYLLFAKSAKQLEKIFLEIVQPRLKELNLSLNFTKIQSGRFHRKKLLFLGFEFIGGCIKISEKSIDHFKKKIIQITHLTKKKPIPAIIKLLNNQILGFGHYYKFANCHNIFKELDSFCRFRLRRYILRNRDLLPKTGNLLLSNQALKELGLKSLFEIKLKFDQKFNKKFQKKSKKERKSGREKSFGQWSFLEQISSKYIQIQILKELQKLTSFLEKLEKRVCKIEKELENRKDKNL